MKEPSQPLAAGCEIALQNPSRYPEAGARQLRPWLALLVAAVAPQARSLGVRFSGDREVRRLNRTYRGKDKTTDVLSFPGDLAADGHLGDILISVPVARLQAAAAGHSTEREIKILLLHGVLHCMGYDHEADEGEMERLERRLRRAWVPPEPSKKMPKELKQEEGEDA
jgi:probable rRNA maturation factor